MPGDSHIWRAIIAKLKNADTLRYGRLRLDDIDRDLFNYHLKQLVDKGIITKLADKAGYTLSDKGKRKVADVLHTSDQADRLFKINPLLIVLDRRGNDMYVINQTRTSQPNYGIVGVPGGTILKTEPLLVGAKRKLAQETGLIADFEYVALTRRIVYKDIALFADVFFPICLATSWSGTLTTTEFGSNDWYPI